MHKELTDEIRKAQIEERVLKQLLLTLEENGELSDLPTANKVIHSIINLQ